MTWIETSKQLPPEGVVVETKISNPDRNQADLKLKGNLWYHSDGSMCVYYTPTHWRKKMPLRVSTVHGSITNCYKI